MFVSFVVHCISFPPFICRCPLVYLVILSSCSLWENVKWWANAPQLTLLSCPPVLLYLLVCSFVILLFGSQFSCPFLCWSCSQFPLSSCLCCFACWLLSCPLMILSPCSRVRVFSWSLVFHYPCPLASSSSALVPCMEPVLTAIVHAPLFSCSLVLSFLVHCFLPYCSLSRVVLFLLFSCPCSLGENVKWRTKAPHLTLLSCSLVPLLSCYIVLLFSGPLFSCTYFILSSYLICPLSSCFSCYLVRLSSYIFSFVLIFRCHLVLSFLPVICTRPLHWACSLVFHKYDCPLVFLFPCHQHSSLAWGSFWVQSSCFPLLLLSSWHIVSLASRFVCYLVL